MAAYDAWQTTFFFSVLSNSVSGTVLTVKLGAGIDIPKLLAAATATAQAEFTGQLQTAFANTLNGADGVNTASNPDLGATDWKVVWGPQVFVVGPAPGSLNLITRTANFTATNAVAAVWSPSLKRYIVAVAATNPVSVYDWLTEDFDVGNVTAWEGALKLWNGGKNDINPSSSIPCISQGTFTGISNLLGMTDTVTTNQTLIAWLKSVTPAAGSTLTFAGHSLAGALSPTLTMACFDATAGLLKGSAWKVGDAMIYPTAGATPGNGPFADLVNGTKFGGVNGAQPWQKWNTDLYNNLDVVPRAWDPGRLNALPQIYSAYYDKVTVALLTGLVDAALFNAAAGVATAGSYASINRSALNGEAPSDAADEFVYQYNVTVEDQQTTELLTVPQAAISPYSPTDQTKVSWTQQLLFQHTTAYGQLILGKPPAPQS
jgi:hypothetical protein